MSLEYVGTLGRSGAGTISLTALTGGISSSVAAGDVVFVLAGGDINATTNIDMSGVVTTSGYTLVTELYSNSTLDANFALFYKVMSGSPDANVTLTSTAANSRVYVWRGTDGTTPLDVTTTTATGTGPNPNSPSVTPITTGAVVLSLGTTTTYTTQTAPSGYGNVANNSTVVAASKAWTSGAEDPAAWTGGSGGAYAWCACSVALRPAVSQNNALFFGGDF